MWVIVIANVLRNFSLERTSSFNLMYICEYIIIIWGRRGSVTSVTSWLVTVMITIIDGHRDMMGDGFDGYSMELIII